MTQPRLAHQRDHFPTEEFKVRQIVEEVHLHAVAARVTQPAEPLDDLRGRANKVNIAADHPLRTGMAAP